MIDTVEPGKPNSVPEQTGVWYAKQMRGNFANNAKRLNVFHYGAQRERDLLLPLTHPAPNESQLLHTYKNSSKSHRHKRASKHALKNARKLSKSHGKNKALLEEQE